MPSIVTANNLRTGAVVYLAAGGDWVEDINEAHVASDKQALKAIEPLAEDAIRRTEVTSVYALPVDTSSGHPTPVSVREQIRAARGPSV